MNHKFVLVINKRSIRVLIKIVTLKSKLTVLRGK